ncbi:IS3 family transposase [Salinicoccus roseus]
MIYVFITDHQHELHVSKMRSTLSVSKSSYCEWRIRPHSPQKQPKEEVKDKIHHIHKRLKARYGSSKSTRYMKEVGIRSKTAKSGEILISDITYIPTKEGWLYLATMMNLYSWHTIGWVMSGRMMKTLLIHALKRAFQTQNPTLSLIQHSDRASQYVALDYQALMQANDITTSMSRRGNCYDNACIELFYSIIKKELIHHENYATRAAAIRIILKYIVSLYNYEKVHFYIDYMSPIEYEGQYVI